MMNRVAPLPALLAALLLMQWATLSAQAVQPDEVLKNPVLEQQARDISAELRCLVCQNQSIDDSEAPLARDLRLLVRERLQAGDSHRDVIEFVVARYGEFILLRPRLSAKTYVLWTAPLLLLGGGLFMAYRLFRLGARPEDKGDAGLSDAEQSKLRHILDNPQD
jgi:cytochrome c-type biogenesis protein CcmH